MSPFIFLDSNEKPFLFPIVINLILGDFPFSFVSKILSDFISKCPPLTFELRLKVPNRIIFSLG